MSVVKDSDWLAVIVDGKSLTEIAETVGTSKRRIQSLVELALRSPDLLSKVATGEQPDALTSDYLIKTGFSALWAKQQHQFANL